MLYNRIKTLADSKKISILQIERECGITPSSIYHWNEVKPSYDKVVSVARFLEVSIEELLSGVEETL